MITFDSKDCTRTLDVAIAEERVRYASERVDFHDFFPAVTVPAIQKVLRRETPLPDGYDTRKELVGDLFHAQQQSPHRLWELLLLQVVEPTLLKRRQTLSLADDLHLDALVVSTFIAALENIPFAVSSEDALAYTLRVSRRALARTLREERGEAPRSATKRAAIGVSVRKVRATVAASIRVATTTAEVPR